MTIKQQINHGDIQWHFSCRKPVSRFVNLSMILKREKKLISAYMAASSNHVISKETESRIFRQNWIFRHTCISIKKPY